MNLLKNAEKQILYRAIQETGYNPNDFEIDEDSQDFILTLKESDADMGFVISSTVQKLKYDCRYDKFADTNEPNRLKLGHTLPIISETLKNWLRVHVREYLLDKQLGNPWSNTEINQFGRDEKFSPKEIQQIESALDEFPTFLKTIKIEKEKEERILAELKEIKEDLRNDKKKKWYRQLQSFTFEVVKFVARDENMRGKIIKFFQTIFDNIQYLP